MITLPLNSLIELVTYLGDVNDICFLEGTKFFSICVGYTSNKAYLYLIDMYSVLGVGVIPLGLGNFNLSDEPKPDVIELEYSYKEGFTIPISIKLNRLWLDVFDNPNSNDPYQEELKPLYQSRNWDVEIGEEYINYTIYLIDLYELKEMEMRLTSNSLIKTYNTDDVNESIYGLISRDIRDIERDYPLKFLRGIE